MISPKKQKSAHKRIYLDANILISYFSTSKEEEVKKKLTKTCLEYISSLEGVDLFTSSWALSEMTNILISRHKMKTPKVSRIEEEFSNKERLGEVKVRLMEASPLGRYSVKEFFYDVRSIILKYNPGVGDAMHSVIMKNHKIKTILTFDKKFKPTPGVTVLEPHAFIDAYQETS